MSRSATIFLLLGMPLAATAQERQPGDPVPLLVSGAAVSIPSLKFRLRHDRREMVPGNAATLYYRTHAILYENKPLFKDLKEIHWSEWSEMAALGDLPKEEVRAKLDLARSILREAENAGRPRDCDWQLDGREEGFGLLLPEVQGYRGLATVMAVKARLAVAEGHPTEAVESLRPGLTLGRNLSHAPTLIHVLVGIACSQVMLKQVETLVQHPDAPNLYWALTELPQPFIDPRRAALDDSGLAELSLSSERRASRSTNSCGYQSAPASAHIRALLNFRLFEHFWLQACSKLGCAARR